MVRKIRPERIGHGLAAARDKKLLKEIAKQVIILELCPSSNLRNNILKGVHELRATIRTFLDAGVRVTINTDGPEMYRTSVVKEEEFLLAEGIMSQQEIEQCRKWAFEGAFVRSPRHTSAER